MSLSPARGFADGISPPRQVSVIPFSGVVVRVRKPRAGERGCRGVEAESPLWGSSVAVDRGVVRRHHFAAVAGPDLDTKSLFARVVRPLLLDAVRCSLADPQHAVVAVHGTSDSGRVYTAFGSAKAPGIVRLSLAELASQAATVATRMCVRCTCTSFRGEAPGVDVFAPTGGGGPSEVDVFSDADVEWVSQHIERSHRRERDCKPGEDGVALVVSLSVGSGSTFRTRISFIVFDASERLRGRIHQSVLSSMLRTGFQDPASLPIVARSSRLVRMLYSCSPPALTPSCPFVLIATISPVASKATEQTLRFAKELHRLTRDERPHSPSPPFRGSRYADALVGAASPTLPRPAPPPHPLNARTPSPPPVPERPPVPTLVNSSLSELAAELTGIGEERDGGAWTLGGISLGGEGSRDAIAQLQGRVAERQEELYTARERLREAQRREEDASRRAVEATRRAEDCERRVAAADAESAAAREQKRALQLQTADLHRVAQEAAAREGRQRAEAQRLQSELRSAEDVISKLERDAAGLRAELEQARAPRGDSGKEAAVALLKEHRAEAAQLRAHLGEAHLHIQNLASSAESSSIEGTLRRQLELARELCRFEEERADALERQTLAMLVGVDDSPPDGSDREKLLRVKAAAAETKLARRELECRGLRLDLEAQTAEMEERLKEAQRGFSDQVTAGAGSQEELLAQISTLRSQLEDAHRSSPGVGSSLDESSPARGAGSSPARGAGSSPARGASSRAERHEELLQTVAQVTAHRDALAAQVEGLRDSLIQSRKAAVEADGLRRALAAAEDERDSATAEATSLSKREIDAREAALHHSAVREEYEALCIQHKKTCGRIARLERERDAARRDADRCERAQLDAVARAEAALRTEQARSSKLAADLATVQAERDHVKRQMRRRMDADANAILESARHIGDSTADAQALRRTVHAQRAFIDRLERRYAKLVAACRSTSQVVSSERTASPTESSPSLPAGVRQRSAPAPSTEPTQSCPRSGQPLSPPPSRSPAADETPQRAAAGAKESPQFVAFVSPAAPDTGPRRESVSAAGGASPAVPEA